MPHILLAVPNNCNFSFTTFSLPLWHREIVPPADCFGYGQKAKIILSLCIDKGGAKMGGAKKVSHEAVIFLRKRNPQFTLQEIGEKARYVAGWGKPITRERVRQILARAGKTTASSPKRRSMYCHQCGASSRKKRLFATSLRGRRVWRCEACQTKRQKARYIKNHIEKRCPSCSKKFVVPWWQRKQKCCSGKCRSRWAILQKILGAKRSQ
ncbi:MAG: hypothetical protein AAB904_00635 [Patescibacteria group bacterium]